MNKKIIFALCLAVLSVFTLKYACADSAELKKSGIVLDMKEGKLTVVGLFPDSPASKAGVLKGDVIAEIDKGQGFRKITSGSVLHPANQIMNAVTGLKLRVDRNGRTVDISLPQGKTPLRNDNTPKTGINDGRIISIDNNNIKTSFSAGSGIIEGDGFLVINGGQVLGTAKIKKVSSSSEMNLSPELRPNTDKLQGATLVFYEPSTYRFTKPIKSLTSEEVKSRTPNPEYYSFKRDAFKNGYSHIPFARVENHNPNAGVIEISTNEPGSSIPGGPVIFNLDAPRVHFNMSIDKNALFFTSARMDGEKVQKLPQLKKGSNIEVFYKPEGNAKRIYLVVFEPQK